MKIFIKISVIFLTIFTIFSSSSSAADRILTIPKPTVEEEVKEITAKKVAQIKYGLKKRLKLTPPAKIATISELLAILEVKNITEIKIKSGLNMLAK